MNNADKQGKILRFAHHFMPGLAGVPAVFSMYSAIFPLLAYALFGSSRQLMTGYAALLTFAGTLGMSEGGRLYSFNSSELAEFPRLGNGNSVLKDDIQNQRAIGTYRPYEAFGYGATQRGDRSWRNA